MAKRDKTMPVREGKSRAKVPTKRSIAKKTLMPPTSGSFVVNGHVRDTSGRPQPRLMVRAYDQALRKSQKLGEAWTDQEGRYRITYGQDAFCRAEKGNADLYTVVLDADDVELSRASVLFNAPTEATIDHVISTAGKPVSEYEQILNVIQPLLLGQSEQGQNLSINELTEKDIDFLSQDTGLPVQQIRFLVQAVKSADASSIHIASHRDSSCDPNIPVELYYGWFRKGLPTDLSALWAQPDRMLVSTLKTAIIEAIIPKISEVHLDELISAIADLTIDHVLKPAKKDQPGSLGDLLSTMPCRLSDEKERTAVIVLRDRTLTDEEVSRQLKEKHFSDEEISNIGITRKLGTLADHHTALIKDLQARRRTGADTSLRYLATLNTFDWMQLINKHGPSPGAIGDLEDYALELERRVEEQHPTAVLAARVENGSLEFKGHTINAAAEFLRQHSALELKQQNVIAYLNENAGDLEEPQKAQVAKGLQQIQRIQKITRNWRETGVLLNKGFDSSLAIIKYGENAFVEAVDTALPPERAADIFANAQITHDTAIATFVEAYLSFVPSTFSVFAVQPQSDQTSPLANYPNIRHLFGNLDMCECAHCQSVLSPAAYLVDLLEFLDPLADVTKDTGEKPLRPSALPALLGRRLDIADLELTCVNTKTEVPYIDLVLEILENAIGLPIEIPGPYSFDPKTDLNLEGKAVAPDVVKKIRPILERSAISVGERLTARKSERQLLIGTHTDWLVTDGARHWVLRYFQDSITFWKDGFLPSRIDSDDYPGMVKQLNAGQLPHKEWVIPKNGSKRDRYLPLKEAPEVTPGKDDNTWIITYTRAIRVVLQLEEKGAEGKLNIKTVQGQKVDSISVGSSVLRLLEKRLLAGTISEPLASLLPSGHKYSVTEIRESEWELSIRGEMKLVYSPSNLRIISLAYQSTDGRPDLLASPENRNPEAYDKLAAAVYPWTLPFDLWLEEVRVFLDRRGLTRRQLMERSNPTGRLKDASIVREVLALSQVESDILIDPVQESWTYWGLQAEGNRVSDSNDGRSVATGSWLSVLKASVSFLLQQAGLSYRELRNVLQSQFVQKVKPSLTLVGDECNVSSMGLQGLSDVHLDKIHRLARLWRKLGWSLFDLDLGIAAVTNGAMDLTAAALRGISHLKRLHELLDLPIGTIAQWWAPLTVSYVNFASDKQLVIKSAYERKFLNPVIANPPDADFLLNEQKSELAYLQAGVVSLPLLSKASRLIAILGIKQSELAELVSDLVAQHELDDPASLKLANLSSIFRHVGLTKSLNLSIQDYLKIKNLLGINPFQDSEKAVEFVENVRFIEGSGFSIEELEYLLRNPLGELSVAIFSMSQASQILTDLRSALQSNQKEVLTSAEPSDEHLRKMLLRVGWYGELIEEAIGLVSFNNLATMPGTVAVPSQVNNEVRYHQATSVLTVSLRLTEADWDALIAANAAKQTVLAAITQLRGRVNTFLAALPDKIQRMQSFDLPTHQVSYTTAAKVVIPPDLGNRCFLDRTKKVIACVGWLTNEQKNRLKKALPQTDGQIADLLKAQSDKYPEPEELNRFLVGADDVKGLFAVDRTKELRVQEILERILSKLNRNTVVERLTSALDVNEEMMRRLLILQLPHAEALDVLHDSAFVASDTKVSIAMESFPDQFAALCKVQKATLVGRVLNLKATQLTWLPSIPGHPRTFNVLNLNTLPVKNGDQLASLAEWQQLVRLFALRDRREIASSLISRVLVLATANNLTDQQSDEKAQHSYLAQGLETSVEEIARAAHALKLQWAADYTNPAQFRKLVEQVVHSEIAKTFKVGLDDVAVVIQRLGLTWPTDVLDPAKLEWLCDLLGAVQRLGAGASELFTLAEDRLATNTTVGRPGKAEAFLARGLLRAKYDEKTWAAQLRPITNVLRDKQRAALVAYLIVHPPQDVEKGSAWRTPNDLYDHYLIDVEMSPCRVSTRILHAISAVQLFIQRCLMNLEAPKVLPSAIDAKRWEWMKNYRVWEANRKVFLYPENWIEPELRDDKSELFKELEGQLSQNELDNERATEILKGYLKGLEDIARLNIIGMYVEKVIDVNGGSTGETVVHIVGRTQNKPSHFFYRRWILSARSNYWTAWEKVPLDGVKSDHVYPFIMQGDVYLAWPEILRLPSESDKADAKAPGPKWQLKMAWVRKSSRGWSDRFLSGETIEHPWVYGKDENQTFTFRVRGGQLDTVKIDCYGALRDDSIKYSPPSSSTPDVREFSARVNLLGHVLVEFRGNVSASYDQGTAFTPIQNALVKARLILNGSVDDTRRAQDDIHWDLEHDFSRIYKWEDIDAVRTDSDGNFSLRLSLPAGIARRVGFYRDTVQNLSPKFLLEAIIDGKPPQTKDYPYRESSTDVLWTDLRFHYNFIFEKEGKPPELGDGRPLQMSILKTLVLLAAEDAYFSLEQREPLSPPNETEVYASGFLARNPTQAVSLPVSVNDDGMSVWGQHPSRYFLLLGSTALAQLPEVLFYRESNESYFIRRENAPLDPIESQGKHQVLIDGHPYILHLRRMAAMKGIASLFDPDTEEGRDLVVSDRNQSANVVDAAQSLIQSGIRFEPDEARSPYASYNTELFFHVPFLIANYLTRSQRYVEAQRWFHYIFDPTTNDPTPGNARYWRYLPFRTHSQTQPIDQLLKLLSDPAASNDPRKVNVETQIERWLENPFRPHAVARLRPRAYEFAVVFKYLDNLIDWGDQLFRQYSTESINEATQLYILAAKLLGPRPQTVPRNKQAAPLTYRMASEKWDEFANTWAEVEASTRWIANTGSSFGYEKKAGYQSGATYTISSIGMLYFCVPINEKMFEYWDKLEDRLFNIRHCRNIEGIEQEVPLFQPPIDPALLVRATAAGLDLGAVLSEAAVPLPHYRFSLMAQKASELCGEVKALGGALLAALEKKDAEQLTLLRSKQELELLDLVKAVKEQQIEEAKTNLEALQQSEKLAIERFTQYQRLLGKANVEIPNGADVDVEQTSSVKVARNADSGDLSGLGVTQAEQDQIDWSEAALRHAVTAGIHNIVSGIAYAIPTTEAGTPFLNAKFGGINIGSILSAGAAFFTTLERNANHQASRVATIGQYQRRQDEWVFQSRLALREIKQIQKQILAATIRRDIAIKELTNHDKQIKNAQESDRFMREKYTNQELYGWMVQQLSGIYFKSYQLAYDVAKRAERSFRNELGLQSSNYIQFGYWDSLKKGLLAGEKLGHDLKRMEVAYLEQNRREYEVTKHVSLLQLDPLALVVLKKVGRCEFKVPEALFDLDYPGHYMRRLKSVSVTIPCVAGPYTSVSCTVTLLKSEIRHNPSQTGGYGRDLQNDDPRFTDLFGTIQSMVTSSGQSDSGMFETNLRDERYLPFEGAGAISTWRLELPHNFMIFDYNSISDVVLHLRYTAREGGEGLRTAGASNLRTAINAVVTNENGSGPTRLFSLKYEFPTEWHQFLNTVDEDTSNHKQVLSFGAERFPFYLKDKFVAETIKVKRLHALAILEGKPAGAIPIYFTPPGETLNETTNQIELSKNTFGEVPYGLHSFQQPKKLGSWTLQMKSSDLDGLRDTDRNILLKDLLMCFELTLTA